LVLASTSRGTWVREHLVFETDASTFEAADRPEAGGDAFTEAVLAAGRTPSTTFAMRIAPCPKHIAERLGTEPDSLVCVRSVIQKVDGVPWSQQVSYYSMDIAEQCGLTVPHNIKEGTVRRMASFGHVEVACIDEHTSRPPTPAEQARLGMPVGTPMKVWTRTAATTTRVTRVTVTFLPSDRNLIVHKQGISAGLRVIQATRAAWTQA
jgi:GntR family transcriptional regulator